MLAENLGKIDEWLAVHADRIAASLNEPANSDDLMKLQNIVGKKLPQDFVSLYSWHNGLSGDENFGSLFYGMSFNSLDQIIDEYHNRKNLSQDSDNNWPLKEKTDKGIARENVHNPDWLRFGDDWSGNGLFLDLSPAEDGVYGQIIYIDCEEPIGILVAPSTERLVEDFLKDIYNDLYSLNSDAMEDGNHFLDADQTIDVNNWTFSTRWKR